MSSNDVAISVTGLFKSYRIRHNAVRHTTLADALLSRLRHPMRRSKPEEFWALADVTFRVDQGEVVGIVGRNGAGKSTLLKVLSRITTPTRGEVELYGRVGSLLEVGTGFHPELTGRENVFLNGAILGMRRREIARRFDEIVTFAGIERFLDTPVKRYSSGMAVRLAFSVAAHLDTDLLLVDEVLAVGDQEFQYKCLNRMRDVAAGGRTVVFVSHNLQAVRDLCSRAIWVASGKIIDDGPAESILSRYAAEFYALGDHLGASDIDRRPGTGELRVADAYIGNSSPGSDRGQRIRFKVRRRRPYKGKYFVSAHVVDEHGATLLQCDSRLAGVWIEAEDIYEGELEIRHPWLRPGRYTVNLYICAAGIIDIYEPAIAFDVAPFLPYSYSAGADATAHGIVLADFSYREVTPTGLTITTEEPIPASPITLPLGGGTQTS